MTISRRRFLRSSTAALAALALGNVASRALGANTATSTAATGAERSLEQWLLGTGEEAIEPALFAEIAATLNNGYMVYLPMLMR